MEKVTLPYDNGNDSVIIDMFHASSNGHTIENTGDDDFNLKNELQDMPHPTTNGHIIKIKELEDFELQNELRHMLRAMAFFGLCPTPRKWQKPGSRTKVFYSAHRVYCLAVLLLFVFNCVRTVVAIVLYKEVVAMQITMASWWCLCAINTAIWYYICSTDDLPRIINLWQTSCQSSGQSKLFGTSVAVNFARKVITIFLNGAMAIIIFNTLIIAGSRFAPFESLTNDTIFMVVPRTEPFVVWDIVLVVSAFYATAAFILPPVFLMISCFILSHQFKKFTKRCVSSIASNTAEARFNGCLQDLRRQHQYLAKMVFETDETFSFYLAVTFVFLIVVSCFLTYQLVVAQNFSNFVTSLMIAFWICLASSKFAVVGLSVAQVHEKAHDIVNHIHDIGMFDFRTHEEVTQMNMFMAKLNGSPIAFTLWNFVPLTKEFLLTVVGVYITYFALVAQSF